MKSILVPLGNTEHSEAALKVAIGLAEKAGALLRGLYVRDQRKARDTYLRALPYPTISPDLNQSILDKTLESVITEMDNEEHEVTKKFDELMQGFSGAYELIVETGQLDETVLKWEKSVDLIVMGKSREAENPKTPVLSEHARAIIQKSYRSCLVVTDGHEPGDSILLAYGGSPTAGKALRETAVFAKLLDAGVSVLTVKEEWETAEPFLETAARYLKAHGIEAEKIWKKSDVMESIAAIVKEKNISMLIMGAYGHNTWRELIFGNNTEKVIGKFDIPLLLCS